MKNSVSEDIVNIQIKECRRKEESLQNPSIDSISVREKHSKATIADKTFYKLY